MYCPNCRGEYREGFTWCQDCDVALVDALPDEPAEEEPKDRGVPGDDENGEGVEGQGTEGGAGPDREKSLRALELLLVLFVAFGRPVLLSIRDWVTHYHPKTQDLTLYQQLSGTLEAVIAIALLRYVLFRHGKSWRQLGLTAEKADVLPTLLLTFLAFLGNAAVRVSFGHSAFIGVLSDPLRALSGIPNLGLLGIVYYLTGAAWEELIVRAYMITEVVELTGQVPLAVLSSTCFQALYHVHQGRYYVLMDAVTFLILSLYYVKYRRITPVLLSHWFYNLLLIGYGAAGS